MLKIKSLLTVATFFLGTALFLLLPGASVSAETCKLNTKLDFVARDPNGSYIPNAKVEVYKQRVDANGHVKPTTKVSSATADANLGIALLSWRNSEMSDIYAVKVYLINKPAAHFWYYGLTLGCGESAQREETLSGIDFTIRDADGELLTNTSFNIYSQLYDESSNSQKIKKDLLITLNSGAMGQAIAYLPQGSIRSIDNKASDVYALEITRAGIKSVVYDIKVTDKELTTFDFFTSAIRVRLQNLAGANYPVNTKLEVYKQELDADGIHKQGAKVGTLTIGADGYGSLELPVGLYVLGLKGSNGKYQYFWDTEVIDGRSTDYTFTPAENWNPNVGVCQNNSNFILSLRDTDGDLAIGLKFELYEQLLDFNGLPMAGTKAGGGTIDKSGSAKLTFKPDPRKIYALKVWDKQANVGEFWFYDGIRFVCDYDRIVTKTVPSLTIVLRDGKGKLKPNYAFSLYSMRYDVDGKPTYSAADLVGNLKTDNGGSAKVYVAYYNPYRASQSGFYIFSTKNSAGQVVYVNGLYAEKDYTFNYYFSGLSGELRNANSKVLVGKEIRLYEQVNNSGIKSLGKLIAKIKTGSGGLFNFEISPGTYALATVDDLNRENVFWDVAVKAGKAQTLKLKTGLVNFKFGAIQGEALAKDPSINLYPLQITSGNKYERDPKAIGLKLVNRIGTKSLAAGPYLISYKGKNGEYGQTFRVANGKIQTATLNINKASKITDTQTFTVK